MTTPDREYWVVGAGLAGALTVHRLRQEGKEVAWFDSYEPHTSTRTGAGIMNPVTGRKFVFSWQFDTFHAEAVRTYQDLESRTPTILHPLPIWKGLSSPGDVNNWCLRLGEPPYEKYMQDPVPADSLPFLKDCLALGVITPVYRVDMHAVVDQVKRLWGAPSRARLTAVDRLSIEGEDYRVPDRAVLILATGSPAMPVPGLQLPLSPYQGQALLIRSSDLPEDRIIHHKLKVVPYGNDLFWVGTFDQWTELNGEPTPAGRTHLEDLLDRYFAIRYTVVDQVCGIRPSSRTRRPFVGPLPGHPGTYVINGLGTKGASLAPLVVRNLCDHLVHGKELWNELHIPSMS